MFKKLFNTSALKTKVANFNETFFKWRQTIKVERIKKAALYEPGKTDHIDLTTNYTDLQALGLIRESFNKGGGRLRLATKDDIKQADIIAIGGLDFDTPRHLSALSRGAYNLASFTKDGSHNEKTILALQPEVDRGTRYRAAERYNEDKEYYPNYIEDRVKRYVFPKLINFQMDSLNHERFALFSHSIGGREIMMMENAIQGVAKKEYGLNSEEIKQLLSNIKAVCTGCALKPEDLIDNKIAKIIIFLLEDRLPLLPQELVDQLFGCGADMNASTWVHLNNEEGVDTDIYLLKDHNKGEDYKMIDHHYHTLNQYVSNLTTLDSYHRQLVGDYLCSKALLTDADI